MPKRAPNRMQTFPQIRQTAISHRVYTTPTLAFLPNKALRLGTRQLHFRIKLPVFYCFTGTYVQQCRCALMW